MTDDTAVSVAMKSLEMLQTSNLLCRWASIMQLKSLWGKDSFLGEPDFCLQKVFKDTIRTIGDFWPIKLFCDTVVNI